MEVKPHWISILRKSKMTLNHLVVLDMAIDQQDLTGYRETALLRSLGMVDEHGCTTSGKAFYESVIASVDSPVKSRRIKVVDDQDNGFEEFWKEFPVSAQFTYRDLLFKSERTLKSQKQVCKAKYNKLLAEDKITPDVLLRCLQLEVATRKEESYNDWKKQNKLQYMPGCEVWLNGKSYIGYLDRQMPVVVQESKIQEMFSI